MTAIRRSSVGARERRVARRLEARGLPGLGEALVRLRGREVGDGWRIDSLYAVGAEGAVFTTQSLGIRASTPTVVKIPLLPYHRPAELSSSLLRHRRQALRDEARHLERSASPFMPQNCGLHEFANPLLDVNRGGPFMEPDVALVMERLAGLDADLWLARIHRSGLAKSVLQAHLDAVSLDLLSALQDLHERGFFYADLRPGNLRVVGRPLRSVRLLDAGSLVAIDDASGRFPHVPHYLPPDLFDRRYMGDLPIVPTAAVQAVMAGRTLYEIATGRVPVPGRPIDGVELAAGAVSPVIADVIDGLATGSFAGVAQALRYVVRRGVRPAPPPIAAPIFVAPATPAPVPTPPRAAAVAPPPPAEAPAPEPRGVWRRLLDRAAVWRRRSPSTSRASPTGTDPAN